MRKLFGRKKKDSGQPAITSQEQPSHGHASAQGSEGAAQVTERSSSNPFQSRGDELARNNDYNGAVVMYDAALSNSPYDRNILLSRSMAHTRSTPPRLDLALKDADETLVLNPRWWEGWFAKGKILFKMGDLENAEDALTNAAGFAHSTDKARVQGVLDEVRASQVETQVQSLSLGSPTPSWELVEQPQSIAQHPSTSTAEPPSYEESQRKGPTGSERAIEKPSGSKDEPKSKPTLDHDAMMAKLIPEDPNLETHEQMHHTWRVEQWKGLGLKEYGPIFKCGGSPWQIFVFPNGNGVDHVSMYFQHGYEKGKVPVNWYNCVQFAIVMWDPTEPSKYVSSKAQHRFNADEGDWGFTKFLDLRQAVKGPLEGHDTPLIDNDEVNITAYVRVIKDPTGVLWHNFLNYDSKKETGMVGLKNQGATGYLNVILQSFYFTNSLRKAVYRVPTEKNATRNVVWGLQRLFYALQTSDTAVPTRELTTTFGWGPLQAFEPQDVKEMSTILLERVDAAVQGTPMKNALQDIFGGEYKQYITSTGVGYEESTTQSMWDLELDTQRCSSLHKSFKDYLRSDTEEAYDIGHPSKHHEEPVDMGLTFTHLPPVLQIYLRRYHYDIKTDTMIKTNNYHEFPEEFDASAYLSPDTNLSEPWTYRLMGVTVHSGDMMGGEYYVFRRPTKDGPFYKFDDQTVSRATLREVMNDNFGGEGSRLGTRAGGRYQGQERSRNAYMLVYIRKSRLDEVLVDVGEEDVPEHIRNPVA
ncbi:hypothetical protein FQN54_000724 [Arachnomyces sp. PD_36]|nr:hypothetical protein FQN54_000724 [Arachnomyces sp. PD_36]